MFLRGLVDFASLFVVLLLCVSSTGYIDAELPQGSHLVNNILIYVTACLAAVVGVILIRRRAQPPDASADRGNRTPEVTWRVVGLSSAPDRPLVDRLIWRHHRSPTESWRQSQRAFVRATTVGRLRVCLGRAGCPAGRAARRRRVHLPALIRRQMASPLLPLALAKGRPPHPSWGRKPCVKAGSVNGRQV